MCLDRSFGNAEGLGCIGNATDLDDGEEDAKLRRGQLVGRGKELRWRRSVQRGLMTKSAAGARSRLPAGRRAPEVSGSTWATCRSPSCAVSGTDIPLVPTSASPRAEARKTSPSSRTARASLAPSPPPLLRKKVAVRSIACPAALA